MTEITKDRILSALPSLTRNELEQIQAVTATLLGQATGPQAQPATPLAGTLIDAISAALNAAVSLQTLSGTTAGKTLNKYLPAIEKFLDAHFDGWNLNKLTEAAFLRMLMELLRDDLRARRLNPSVGIMTSNLGRLPEVFEHAYPGYLEARMGGVILKHFSKVQMPAPTPVGRKKPRRISM